MGDVTLAFVPCNAFGNVSEARTAEDRGSEMHLVVARFELNGCYVVGASFIESRRFLL